MYIPKKYEQKDTAQLTKFINDYPFATLICNTHSGLEANHIPFILTQSNGKDVLQAHIARANPLWKDLKEKPEAMVIFNGPNCYVSPNYYPTKKENGRAVPTWNYVAVHVKGTLSFIQDDRWVLQMLNQLTQKHEAAQAKPWSIADAPNNYIQKMLSAVIGIEIDVTSIFGKWKLSQNQPKQNQQGVVSGLSQAQEVDSKKIAELVNAYILDNIE